MLGLRAASQRLEGSLRAALGPRASLGAVRLGLTGLEVSDLRIRGARGAWPAADELVARRVHLRPGLASLWSRGWHIAASRSRTPTSSLLRTRQGKLRVLPALLEKPAAPGPTRGAHAPRVRIAQVVLTDVAIDFHDASVRQGCTSCASSRCRPRSGPLDFPALDSTDRHRAGGRAEGPAARRPHHHPGRVHASPRCDAKLKAAVRGVDLVALQPYLLKVNEAGVKHGTLDLTLDATVKAKRLHAPGRVTLTGLELASGGGLLATFGGVPRQAVLAAMERDGRIEVGFTLDGRLDDPAFSINDNLATKLAGGLAETLGVSLGGVVEGVGSVIKGLLGR